MSAGGRKDADSPVKILCTRTSFADRSVTGVNVGVNCGESSGRTISTRSARLEAGETGGHAQADRRP